MKTIAIIPARYASTRFPGKPLVEINGKTMIERVYQQAKMVSELAEVIVATDDERIFNAVKSFGGNVIMTLDSHQSGTDRCAEVIGKLTSEFDVVINIQGDEPFIKPEQIKELIACFNDTATEIATLKKKIEDLETIHNPNVVKVVCNTNGFALYFSRNPIPFVRNADKNEWLAKADFYKHIGIYGYKTDVLLKCTQLPVSFLEKTESLEQLRWLENGYKIKVAETTFESIGIDTPEDLEKIRHTTN
jgi:3-deoxy-manno-octulosonate cytidylyltransferase (CMP-KDO synthetase)